MPCPYCEATDGEGAIRCRSDKTDCAVSGWSAWSACTATCHEGTNSRTRSVVEADRCGGELCPALMAQSVMCFERACDCDKVTCKYEHHDCTTYYDRVAAPDAAGPTYRHVLSDNKMVSTATRSRSDPADSVFSSKTGIYSMGGLGTGPHDGSAADVVDTHDAVQACHDETSVRVYHDSTERRFVQQGTMQSLQEGHHCKMLLGTGTAGTCACRCHANFRHGYNPKHASSFGMACGVIHGLECGDSY
jgi:hypothetical protein